MAGILDYSRYIDLFQTIKDVREHFPNEQLTVDFDINGNNADGWTAEIDFQTLIIDKMSYLPDRTPDFRNSTVIGYFPYGTRPPVANPIFGILQIPAGMYQGPILPDRLEFVPITVLGFTFSRDSEVWQKQMLLIENWTVGVPIGDPRESPDFTPIPGIPSTLTLTAPSSVLKGDPITFRATTDIPLPLNFGSYARFSELVTATFVQQGIGLFQGSTATFSLPTTTRALGTGTFRAQFNGNRGYGAALSNIVNVEVIDGVPLKVDLTLTPNPVTPVRTVNFSASAQSAPGFPTLTANDIQNSGTISALALGVDTGESQSFWFPERTTNFSSGTINTSFLVDESWSPKAISDQNGYTILTGTFVTTSLNYRAVINKDYEIKLDWSGYAPGQARAGSTSTTLSISTTKNLVQALTPLTMTVVDQDNGLNLNTAWTTTNVSFRAGVSLPKTIAATTSQVTFLVNYSPDVNLSDFIIPAIPQGVGTTSTAEVLMPWRLYNYKVLIDRYIPGLVGTKFEFPWLRSLVNVDINTTTNSWSAQAPYTIAATSARSTATANNVLNLTLVSNTLSTTFFTSERRFGYSYPSISYQGRPDALEIQISGQLEITTATGQTHTLTGAVDIFNSSGVNILTRSSPGMAVVSNATPISSINWTQTIPLIFSQGNYTVVPRFMVTSSPGTITQPQFKFNQFQVRLTLVRTPLFVLREIATPGDTSTYTVTQTQQTPEGSLINLDKSWIYNPYHEQYQGTLPQSKEITFRYTNTLTTQVGIENVVNLLDGINGERTAVKFLVNPGEPLVPKHPSGQGEGSRFRPTYPPNSAITTMTFTLAQADVQLNDGYWFIEPNLSARPDLYQLLVQNVTIPPNLGGRGVVTLSTSSVRAKILQPSAQEQRYGVTATTIVSTITPPSTLVFKSPSNLDSVTTGSLFKFNDLVTPPDYNQTFYVAEIDRTNRQIQTDPPWFSVIPNAWDQVKDRSITLINPPDPENYTTAYIGLWSRWFSKPQYNGWSVIRFEKRASGQSSVITTNNSFGVRPGTTFRLLGTSTIYTLVEEETAINAWYFTPNFIPTQSQINENSNRPIILYSDSIKTNQTTFINPINTNSFLADFIPYNLKLGATISELGNRTITGIDVIRNIITFSPAYPTIQDLFVFRNRSVTFINPSSVANTLTLAFTSTELIVNAPGETPWNYSWRTTRNLAQGTYRVTATIVNSLTTGSLATIYYPGNSSNSQTIQTAQAFNADIEAVWDQSNPNYDTITVISNRGNSIDPNHFYTFTNSVQFFNGGLIGTADWVRTPGSFTQQAQRQFAKGLVTATFYILWPGSLNYVRQYNDQILFQPWIYYPVLGKNLSQTTVSELTGSTLTNASIDGLVIQVQNTLTNDATSLEPTGRVSVWGLVGKLSTSGEFISIGAEVPIPLIDSGNANTATLISPNLGLSQAQVRYQKSIYPQADNNFITRFQLKARYLGDDKTQASTGTFIKVIPAVTAQTIINSGSTSTVQLFSYTILNQPLSGVNILALSANGSFDLGFEASGIWHPNIVNIPVRIKFAYSFPQGILPSPPLGPIDTYGPYYSEIFVGPNKNSSPSAFFDWVQIYSDAPRYINRYTYQTQGQLGIPGPILGVPQVPVSTLVISAEITNNQPYEIRVNSINQKTNQYQIIPI